MRTNRPASSIATPPEAPTWSVALLARSGAHARVAVIRGAPEIDGGHQSSAARGMGHVEAELGGNEG